MIRGVQKTFARYMCRKEPAMKRGIENRYIQLIHKTGAGGLRSSDQHYLSLAMLEFLDIDFGDISKSESDRYRKDSLR